MDLFSSLQQFYETLNVIKQENDQWNSITSQQVEEVLTRLEEFLRLIEDEYAPEANALCSKIESIHSSFFQLECDRIKEKLRVLVLQLDELVDVMAKRKILLLKYKEFQRFIKDAEDTLLRTMNGASVDAEVDMRRITNEMSAVFDKLDDFGKCLTAYQLDANMTITDISVADALNRIKKVQLGVGPTEEPMGLSKHFQEFFDVSNQLENAFRTDIHSCEHLDDVVEFISVSLENGKKEAELMIRLVTIANDLPVDEKAKADDILSKLKPIMDKRQEVRRVTVEDCMKRSLVILTQKENQLEAIIEHDMNDQNLDVFEADEASKWIPFKKELDQLTMLMRNSNSKWQRSFDELAEKTANFDRRIVRFKNSFAKSKRREQRIIAKLTTFTKWLDLIEEDLTRAESLVDTVEQTERFHNIRNICLSHQKLVDKFLSSKLSPPHSSEVKVQCDRYFALVQRISSMSIPESTRLSNLSPLAVLSQLSLSSLSASGTDEDEGGRGIAAKMLSSEGTSTSYALTERVLQTEDTSKAKSLLSSIDSELNVLADSISELNAEYTVSLKSLSSAQTDLERLRLDNDCDELAHNISGEELAIVRSLSLHLHSLEEPFTTFIRELQKEIDDEIALQANYEGISTQLNRLNTDIDQRARNAIQDVRSQLEHVQSDLKLLRAQCLQRRKYVENMIEAVSPEGSLNNSSRRKKIILMVSRTVTTIIQVVEDELRRSPNTKESLLEFRKKLQDVNTSIDDENAKLEYATTENEQESEKSEHNEEKMIQSELAQIEEKISLANQLLAYGVDLKNADNAEEMEGKVRNIEDVEEVLVSSLNKLKNLDRNVLTDEQCNDMEKMLNEAMLIIDKLHTLRDSITGHLKSLTDWKIAKDEIEDQIGIILDNIEELFVSYSQPQSYTKAINDIGILERLQSEACEYAI
uniref:Uncharacterized protein n=1 Tax=Setaria digitata TaxID=48799 RepID=A0A915PZS9_9BILA